ncbi:hypothetical protein GP486_001328 [Trichoglossum hirsutum]|uniref:NACHT domain-containing protein n=1 Tax=Trichoglossum hirsutum TaxID=265104 RepID=A0A9P8RT76_9PEZI|nr:hypothetical protein GP486_001328 [Trichoglossum hirsutum]
MSDPLSISAGVAGLVSLAIGLSQVNYDYIKAVKGFSKAWSSYVRELSALTSILVQAQQAIEVGGVGHLLVARTPDIPNAIINECRIELESLKQKLSKTGIKKSIEALKWPFTESETQKTVEMLHRFNSAFSLALSVDNLYLKELLDWFRPESDPQSLESVSEQLCESTGLYFLNNELYHNWRDKTVNVLWAYGQPGAGKTILSAAVMGNLGTTVPTDSLILYHFFSTERGKESWHDVLRHLIVQTLEQSKTKPQLAFDPPKKRHSKTKVLPKELADVLVDISKTSPRTYIVLDGLDECRHLAELIKLLLRLKDAPAKVLTTSRDLPDIRKHFAEFANLEVKVSRSDIDHYVAWRLQEGSEIEYGDFGDALKKEIASEIEQHVDGSCTTIKKIRNILKSFPADHEEAYQKTLNRILDQGPGRKELAAKALTWICHVQRPVKMTELQHALAIEKDAQNVDVEDIESPKTILSVCLGLIVISRTDQTVNMIHSTARTFVRSNREKLDPEPELTITQACLTYMVFPELASGPCKSIEEFRTRLSRLPFLDYSARFYGSHAREVEKPSFSQLEAFLEDDNFRESSWQVVQFVFDMDHQLAQAALSMIPNKASAIHVAAYWGFPSLLAAFIAKEPAVKDPQDLLVNKPDSHSWTPLHWAASNGHAGLVQTLLDSRAVIDAEDMSGWTPLFWAVVRGCSEVVSILLNRGADCFHVDGEGMTALHWAISTAQGAIMQQLLAHGERKSVLTPTTRIAHLKTPKQFTVSEAKSVVRSHKAFKGLLDVAAEASDLDTIGALLESRARTLELAGRSKYGYPRTDNNGFMTADPLIRTLWRAWGKGEVFWPREQRHSPLHAFRKRLLEQAIIRELLPIVNLLIELAREHDLNRDILSKEGKHYIHAAACCKDPAILMALIDKGIDVNVKTSHGSTPLHYACIEGSCETIKALLACERLEFAGGESFEESPLESFLTHERSRILRTATDPQGALEVCQAFFSKGLSPKSRDKEGNTLLHLAVATWNPAIIKLLVNSGVDMNARNKYNETPLHRLASSGPPKLGSWQAKSSGEASVVPKPFIDETIQMVLDLSEPENLALAAASYFKFYGESTPLARAINSKSWILADSLHERKARFHTNSIEIARGMLLGAARSRNLKFLLLVAENSTNLNPDGKSSDGNYSALADLIRDFKTASSPVKNSNSEAETPAVIVYTTPREVDPESDDSPETFFSILKAVIRAGADVRKKDYWKVDPLQHAIKARGPPEIVRILLDAGADLSHSNSKGRNTLQVAIAEGATAATISTLLQAGAEPYSQTDNGLDCFQLALINGFEENLSLLLEYIHTHPDCPDSHWLHNRPDEVTGEDTATFFLRALQTASAINTPDQFGHTLLFHAADEGNTKLAQELLEYGVDINASDKWNWAPIHAAVKSRKAETVELLLKSGAKIDQGLKSTHPYIRNERTLACSMNILHVAIYDMHGRSECVVPAIVRLLLEYGANPNEDYVNTESSENTRTSTLKLLFPLVLMYPMTQDILISQETIEAAQYLVDGGADASGVMDDMEIKHVAAFDGYESLWNSLRGGITPRKESNREGLSGQ